MPRANDSRALLLSGDPERRENPHFLLWSRLSIGDVNSGFDDKMAAIVMTAKMSTLLAENYAGLLGSRHLNRAPRTSIFANRTSTGIIATYTDFSVRWFMTTRQTNMSTKSG